MASKSSSKSSGSKSSSGNKSSGGAAKGSSKSVSKSSSGNSRRTYDSESNTWVGNGVTSHSTDGSQSNGKKVGNYALTREKSSIGWVPVATKVEPAPSPREAARPAGTGPGVATVGAPIRGVAAGAISAPGVKTAGPGVAAAAQEPIRMGEVVVTAQRPLAAPVALALGSKPKTSGVGASHTVMAPFPSKAPVGPGKATTATDGWAGFEWKANPWFSDVSSFWEPRFGEPGEWVGGFVNMGADVVYNSQRAVDAGVNRNTPYIGVDSPDFLFNKPEVNPRPDWRLDPNRSNPW